MVPASSQFESDTGSRNQTPAACVQAAESQATKHTHLHALSLAKGGLAGWCELGWVGK
jgi:hypothetical protein